LRPEFPKFPFSRKIMLLSLELLAWLLRRMRGPSAYTVVSLSLTLALAANAQPARFIVDDQAFLDQVAAQAKEFQQAGKLTTVERLQCESNRRFFSVPRVPLESKKLDPPELYDRLRESTLAVGDFFLCSSCTNWHFEAATAFVVASNGVISTSCHVLGDGTEDLPGNPDYLVAADQQGHVYPVTEVLAADPDADTCLLKIDAKDLRPLPLRTGARVGERIYCLSHPEGSLFMFTEGMIARAMWSHSVMGANEPDAAPRPTSRPTYYLNITAEFSPGSSGGPVTDAAGNVVAQVQSISSGVESDTSAPTNSNSAFVSGPVRYCVSVEEIVRMTQPPAGYVAPKPLDAPPGIKPDPGLTSTQIVAEMTQLLRRAEDAIEKTGDASASTKLFKRFDSLADAYETRFPRGKERWEVTLLQARAHQLREEHKVAVYVDDPVAELKKLIAARSATVEQKTEASHLIVMLSATKVGDGLRFTAWEKILSRHLESHPSDPDTAELELKQLELTERFSPSRLEALASKLSSSTNAEVAKAANESLAKPRRSRKKQ
jgi:S1-C subfamily serine protease